MDQEKSVLIQSPASIEDYLKESPQRRWAVVYIGGKTFFLTDEEHGKLLGDIQKGAQIIQVGLLTLTTRFSYIFATKGKSVKQEFEEVEQEGRKVYRAL
jgi:hypothetical protein